jgi:malonyl-CoA O-methyltransferase
MFDASRIRQDFSAAAESYEQEGWLQEQVLLALAQHLPPAREEASLLDAGCGTGRLASLLPPASRVVQIDAAYGMCARAGRNGQATCCAELAALPFADNAFDIVFSSLVLQWLLDPITGLREMRRVCKRGGRALLATFGENSLRRLAASFARVDAYPHVSPFLSRDAFGKQCLEAGLKGEVISETVTESCASLAGLAGKLRGVGARNKRFDRRRSLMTPRAWRSVEAAYRESCGGEILVEWEILYFTGTK